MRSAFTISILLSLLVSGIVIGARNAGMLQTLELVAYDSYLKLRNRSIPFDERIVIVEITEKDIHRLGHWPMTDADMARLIDIVFGQRPGAVGLDLYRDIPVPPGGKDLKKAFLQHNLVCVRKVGDDTHPGVAQPYTAADQQLVGFNDITVDPDGIIRRVFYFCRKERLCILLFHCSLQACILKGRG